MVEDVLARLVAFPSVVGTPNDPIVGWIARRAAGSRGASSQATDPLRFLL